MTKEQFKTRISHLLTSDDGIAALIEKGCISAMASEYAKATFLNAAEDDFILPKTVMAAVLYELAWQYEPHGTSKKDIAKIKPLVKLY